VKQAAAMLADSPPFIVSKNVSAYSDPDRARDDIVLEIAIALIHHEYVVALVDEVDTPINNQSMYQRLIAPMNGEDFFLAGKELSFSGRRLVFFFALSSPLESQKSVPKWEDFLSRIPKQNQIRLPGINSSLAEKCLRAIAYSFA
jgi:hypothetical protein